MVYVKRKTRQTDQVSAPKIKSKVRIPLANGECHFYSFEGLCSYKEHIALSFQKNILEELPLVAIHYGCFRYNVLEPKSCVCGEALWEIIQYCSDNNGILLYSGVEGCGEMVQSDSYNDQSAAQMLLLMGIKTVKLLAGNARQIQQLQGQGIEVEV